jgi:hypothetical protein
MDSYPMDSQMLWLQELWVYRAICRTMDIALALQSEVLDQDPDSVAFSQMILNKIVNVSDLCLI